MFSKFYPVQLLFISFPAERKSFKFNMRITKLYLDIILINLGIDFFFALNLGYRCKPLKKFL